jgi:molecular chaperone HtpG
MEKGQISVQTENIFPIIKKFLYSDQEIFLRELVSNAVDATSKLKALSGRGEKVGPMDDLTIDIFVDKEKGTLTISDRGIGMTEEEVKKYLNQLAFSSAQEFLEKHKDDTDIIGHFGLGFYSAFMVADKVEVVSQSYQEGAEPVRWICEGDPSYELAEAERDHRGTDVILHINDESKEYLEEDRIEGLLLKYAKFLPFPIRFGTRTEKVYEDEEDKEGKEVTVDNIINAVAPLWRKSPQEISDEEYRNFYRELYPMSQPPMFWIHLNIDYPFNLTGILYFPKLANGLEMQKNKIQLYSNQVYVTDDVKEIVPEFLTLLHGVIDSPDIPLNVSRSYLQSDQNVKKITGYITRKVAEKLGELFKENREDYEQKWSDLGPFVKYGMITEDKFYEKAGKFALFPSVDKKMYTLEELREQVKDKQTDKYDRTVLIYTHAPEVHHAAIQAAKNRGYEVLVFDNVLDNHFMQQLESKEDKLTFVRIDSETVDNLVQTDETKESVLNEEQQNKVKELFTGLVDQNAQVELKPLAPDDQPVQIVRPEFMRRMKEMQAMQGMSPDMFPDMFTVVVNSNHPLISEKLLDGEEAAATAGYLYELALLSQHMLTGEKLTQFMNRSLEMLK